MQRTTKKTKAELRRIANDIACTMIENAMNEGKALVSCEQQGLSEEETMFIEKTINNIAAKLAMKSVE